MDLLTMVLTCSAYSDKAIISAMAELNSHQNPLVISGKPFPTTNDALKYAEKLKAEGTSFEIGLMQIPYSALKDRPVPVNLTELLRPCKNMIEASQILTQFQYSTACNGAMSCALSMFKSGDPQAGLDYAEQIIQYASDHPVIPPKPLE